MRLGIFGGTFDPIHIGHLRTAEVAREEVRLDTVLFVPNRVSPFKSGAGVTPPAVRLEMVRRAVADNPAFAVCPIEIERPGPSYTVDTVRALRRERPDAALYLLVGADALRDLALWREPEALLAEARIVAVSRPGTDEDEVRSALPASWLERIAFMTAPGLDISATDLRASVRAGCSIRYLVPPAVEEYIEAQRLYREVAPSPH